jgi:hypothetical protein
LSTLPNCRASYYAVVLLATHCARCGCQTHALAFWVPPGHELLHLGETLADDFWEKSDECRLLHEVTWIDPDSRSILQREIPTVRAVQRNGKGELYWQNHCEHCGAAVSSVEAVEALVGTAPGMNDAPILIMLPVPEPFIASAEGWSTGDLADAPLDGITCLATDFVMAQSGDPSGLA